MILETKGGLKRSVNRTRAANQERAFSFPPLAAVDICELAQALQRDRRADALDMCERPIRIAARLVASRL
jgi:hypothetical protein